MNSRKLLHTLTLSNGLTVSIYDLTKVYFGDYHHVRLTIDCTFADSADEMAPGCPVKTEARLVTYSRTLAKMGVPSKDAESVKSALLNDFQLNSLPYISSPEFPGKMLQAELANKKLPVRKYAGSGS